MAARSLLQPTFAGGELSPSLYGRVDLARYQNSLKTCRNFVIKPQGGLDNRPGTEFVAPAKYADRKCRLIEFEFSAEQTYVIELGHLYMRVYRDGFQITVDGEPLEEATPYTEDMLFEINFVQSADVLTLVHRDVPPQEIRRLADDDWEVRAYSTEIGPFQDPNLDEGLSISSSGVTGTVTLTATGNVFTSANVGTDIRLEQIATGDISAWMNRTEVEVGDLRFVDERIYEAVARAADPEGVGVLTGDTTPVHIEGDAWDGPRTSAQGISEILGYKWRYLNSGFGVVRITAVNSATEAVGTVEKRLPSTIEDGGTYKWSLGAWNSDRGYPGAITYHQQRIVFGGTREDPQTFWMSETGIFNAFGTSMPLEPTDAITYTIASRKINEIRHLVELNQLLAMTAGSSWTISGDTTGLSAETTSVQPQNYHGVSRVAPLVVGTNILYVQSQSKKVRDLGYSFDIDGYAGEDLTLLANHLVDKRTIVDWAFALNPYSLAWIVMSDGALLSMTYLKEQSVLGWARHDTAGGQFESVATILEDGEDRAYVAVKRVINGQTVRYIERMHTRLFDDVEDCFFVDSGLTYDGRNTTDVTLELAGGSSWGYPEQMTLSASGPTFTSGTVGRFFRLHSDDDYAIVKVVSFESETSLTVRTERLVPESLRNNPVTEWGLMAETLSGLDHLEGKEVVVLADGNVEPLKTVVDGSITLQFPAAVAHAGLPITSDMETLAISETMRDGSTTRDSNKLVVEVGLQVEDTRGVFAGQSPEYASFVATDHLNELKQRDTENWGEPTQLATGLVDVKIDSRWDSNGSVFVRQSDPLPLSILGLIARTVSGGKR